jgi:hypothetical protein
MFKMGSHDPFGHLKHIGQKKGRELNWQCDVWPLKVENRPDFLTCRWRATYRWKAFNEGYNLAWNLKLIGGLHAKLCAPKVGTPTTLGAHNFGNLGTHIWESRDKMPFGCWSHGQHKVYYKGEGGDFPQVRAIVNLVRPNLHVAGPSTKNAPAM